MSLNRAQDKSSAFLSNFQLLRFHKDSFKAKSGGAQDAVISSLQAFWQTCTCSI
jgi:hypothetical protein